MEINDLVATFERKLKLLRYSANSIKNYSCTVNGFLQVVARKFNHPSQLSEDEIENMFSGKLKKHKASSSY